MNYHMVDNKSVIDQLHEIHHILNQFQVKDINMDESIFVYYIIEKLSPTWKDYQKELKHKTHDLTLGLFSQHLRVKKDTGH